MPLVGMIIIAAAAPIHISCGVVVAAGRMTMQWLMVSQASQCVSAGDGWMAASALQLLLLEARTKFLLRLSYVTARRAN